MACICGKCDDKEADADFQKLQAWLTVAKTAIEGLDLDPMATLFGALTIASKAAEPIMSGKIMSAEGKQLDSREVLENMVQILVFRDKPKHENFLQETWTELSKFRQETAN